MSRLGFKILAQSSESSARAGVFHTLHNEVKTPLFMPVATHATVRAQRFDELKNSGSQILLANTYHLLLRPGPEVFKNIGGIHPFMNWKKSVLTDSGGYQIFSLPHARKMSEEGARFRSYWDGLEVFLSPEISIQTQRAIGSDIMMVLDQCVPSTSEYSVAEQAVELTFRWAQRSLSAREDSPQALFGIIQGACFENLRKRSAEQITSLPLDGFAIGGLAVGESKAERDDFTGWTASLLPKNLPRYLMGVGTPLDLLEAVHRGVDMFDCILPHALAQQGVAFSWKGKRELKKSQYRFSKLPIDENCGCSTCAEYTCSYLHHLTKSREILGWQLIGAHNIYFYHALMKGMREAILNDEFLSFYTKWKPFQELTDGDLPKNQPQKRLPSAETSAKSRGDYEISVSELGVHSIRQKSSGEVMHPLISPLDEANVLYVEQSQLLARLKESEKEPKKELVLWDVGLGAATNAMAAILAYEKAFATGEALAPLHVVSFERDLDSLDLALDYVHLFPHLKHAAPFGLREKGYWRAKKAPITWTLFRGDFRENLRLASVPEVIYFDPFSYKADSELWRPSVFKQIFDHLGGGACSIYTYSASTGVRAAMLASGFFVGRGQGTGNKLETTAAHTPGNPWAREILGPEWLVRWERSSAKFPTFSEADLDEAAFAARIRNHAQFSNTSQSR